MDYDLHDETLENMDEDVEIDDELDECSQMDVVGNNERLEHSTVPAKECYVEPDYPNLPSEGNLEWQYTMRRTMQEVIPSVFLGPYASATKAKLEEMKAAGLTHIVCVRQNLEKNLIRPNHPDHFIYMIVELIDSSTENIIPHFKPVNKFLNDAVESGGKVLIHGNAGISRSAALVIAYIMSKFGVTLKDAFSYVQSKRFCCNPNEGFMAQLREYEPIYRAQHTVPLPLPGDTQNRTSTKRGLEIEEGKMETRTNGSGTLVFEYRRGGNNSNRGPVSSPAEASVPSTS